MEKLVKDENKSRESALYPSLVTSAIADSSAKLRGFVSFTFNLFLLLELNMSQSIVSLS